MAWVDEGPGPPRCPSSCEYHRSHEKQQFNNYNNNKKYTSKNNNKANNNNNNVNKIINNTTLNMESSRSNDIQQCLDYLGDNDELSPAQICKKSSQFIETKLKTLRLRHCCERTVESALHNQAHDVVLKGGTGCVRTLNEVLETDALAARITCEFSEVLTRYDCKQIYSMKYHCNDCKVSRHQNFHCQHISRSMELI